ERTKASRDIIAVALASTGRARFLLPVGAFYLFFSVDGIDDTRKAALRMIDDIGVGLAPGTAFGEDAERFFRLCFARSPEKATDVAARLKGWIETI
ncbi:MAG: pyridoxal phosphate-dependent aminotransferase, partial [Bosea sp. (in: a-proteobacteria)]